MIFESSKAKKNSKKKDRRGRITDNNRNNKISLWYNN